MVGKTDTAVIRYSDTLASPAVVLLLVTLDYPLTAAVVLVVGQQRQRAVTVYKSVRQFKSLYSVTKALLLPDPAALLNVGSYFM